MKKILAFTLAETLIVMGIIGVVSALTLPNLNSSTGEKEKVAKVKKIYQNLNDALGRAIAVYGPFDEWFISDNTLALQATRFGGRITEFMKISKNCELTANKGCFSKDSPKYIPGGNSATMNDSSANVYRVIVADGASIGFLPVLSGNSLAFIDIDGPNKGSNKIGVDRFVFVINKFESKDHFSAVNYGSSQSQLLTTGDGEGVTHWVVTYDNMDYIKSNATGKCSNSNVTLNEFASPPVVSCK